MECLYCNKNYRLSRDFDLLTPKKENLAQEKIEAQSPFNLDEFKNPQSMFVFNCGYSFIEHTSANPTSPLHLAHIFNALMGDLYNSYYRAPSAVFGYYTNDYGLNFKKLVYLTSSKPLLEETSTLKNLYAEQNKTIDADSREFNQWCLFKFGKDKARNNTIRDLALSWIKEDLSTMNIDVSNIKFYYESDYCTKIDRELLISKGFDGTELVDHQGLWYKKVRLTRSTKSTEDGVEYYSPIYILPDILYRLDVIQKYRDSNLLFIVGRDHFKHESQIQKLLGPMLSKVRKMDFYEYPVIIRNEQRLSKRNNNILSVSEVIEDLKKKGVSRPCDYLRYILLKYINRHTLDYDQILNSSIDFKEYSKWVSFIALSQSLSFEQINQKINKLLEVEKASLNIWANIKAIFHNIFRMKSINKIYSFINYILSLTKNSSETLKEVHSFLLRKTVSRYRMFIV